MNHTISYEEIKSLRYFLCGSNYCTVEQSTKCQAEDEWKVARGNNCWMVGERSVNFPWSPDSTKNIAGSIVNRLSCVYYYYVPFVYYIVVCGLWDLGGFKSIYIFHHCSCSTRYVEIIIQE